LAWSGGRGHVASAPPRHQAPMPSTAWTWHNRAGREPRSAVNHPGNDPQVGPQIGPHGGQQPSPGQNQPLVQGGAPPQQYLTASPPGVAVSLPGAPAYPGTTAAPHRMAAAPAQPSAPAPAPAPAAKP